MSNNLLAHFKKMQAMMVKYLTQDMSDKQFISDMIYMLDGPEQREAEESDKGVVMSEELKPLPFCGGESIVVGHGTPEVWVRCPEIGCKASNEGFGDMAMATTAWSERVELKAGWQPIETAPKDGSIVLLTSTSDLWKYPFPAKWDKDFNWWVFADEPLNHIWSVSDLVTHWMPLPTPPEQDQ